MQLDVAKLNTMANQAYTTAVSLIPKAQPHYLHVSSTSVDAEATYIRVAGFSMMADVGTVGAILLRMRKNLHAVITEHCSTFERHTYAGSKEWVWEFEEPYNGYSHITLLYDRVDDTIRLIFCVKG